MAGLLQGEEAMKEELFKGVDEMIQERINAMTPDKAEAYIRAAAKALGDNDYLSGEVSLNIVAEWIKKQHTTNAICHMFIGYLEGKGIIDTGSTTREGYIQEKTGKDAQALVDGFMADVLGVKK